MCVLQKNVLSNIPLDIVYCNLNCFLFSVTEVSPCEQQYDSSSQKFIVTPSVNNSGEPAKLMGKQELIQALDNKSLGKKKG